MKIYFNTFNQTPQDLHGDCIRFMEEKGFYLNENLVADEAIHRFSKNGERSKKDEWYIAYEGVSSKGNHYLTCPFGSWKTDEKYIFRSWDNNKTLCEEERREFFEVSKRKQEETEKQKKEIHDNAAKKSQEIYEAASVTPPSQAYMSYLDMKKIDQVDMRLRFGLNPQGFPALIIPFYDIYYNIRTLQFISVDLKSGQTYKSFFPQGQKKGNFAIICGDKVKEDREHDRTIYVCEGYATGMSIFMSQDPTKMMVVVAGDAGNLSPVIENLRRIFVTHPIIIVADNDDVGISKANDAAQKYNCYVIVPKFPENKEVGKDGKKIYGL